MAPNNYVLLNFQTVPEFNTSAERKERFHTSVLNKVNNTSFDHDCICRLVKTSPVFVKCLGRGLLPTKA